MSNDHLQFNFVRPHIGYANDQVLVEDSLIAWMNHAFLNIGAFVNISTGMIQAYSGSPGLLQPVKVPGYATRQVYQGFKKDWVWENPSSLVYEAGSPTECSGVYVNGTFYNSTTTTGTYAHRIEFPAGRVVFTNGAIPANSVVRTNFAYRFVQVIKGDAADFNKFEYFSNRADDTNFLSFGSGSKDVAWEDRIQLPCIAMIPGKSDSTPSQLGTLQQWVQQSFTFLVFAEDKFWRDQLLSILINQRDKRVHLIDFNTVAASGQHPLNIYGSKNVSGLMYPDLVKFPGDGHAYGLLTFKNTRIGSQQKIHTNLYYGSVTSEMEYLMR